MSTPPLSTRILDEHEHLKRSPGSETVTTKGSPAKEDISVPKKVTLVAGEVFMGETAPFDWDE